MDKKPNGNTPAVNSQEPRRSTPTDENDFPADFDLDTDGIPEDMQGAMNSSESKPPGTAPNDMMLDNGAMSNSVPSGTGGKGMDGSYSESSAPNDPNASAFSSENKSPQQSNSSPNGSENTGVTNASTEPNAGGEGEGSALGAASAALNAVPNLQSSVEQAANGEIEDNVKTLAEETLRAAPQVAIDAATANVPGLIVDGVNYATKTFPIIAKIMIVALAVIVLFALSIIGTVGMLPSVLFGGIEEKLEERQIDKAQEAISTFYEDRVSEVVSGIVQDMKAEANIGTFSSWKRIVAGKNEDYSVTVSRVNETDSLVTINNVSQNTGIQVTFKDVYLNDFSSVRVDKVSLINAFSYQSAFADDENFLQGKAVDNEKLFTSDETSKWRMKDTSELKDWLKANKDSLVSYTLTPTSTETKDGITYQCYTCSVDSIATLDEISAMFGFSEEQKEQLNTMSFAGNVYISAYDDVSEEDEKILTKNIYPRLDVYTNLVGGSDNLIWSMLPPDYMHLIAEDDSTGTAMLINEILKTAKEEIGYIGTTENSSKYNQFVGTDNVPWSASFISWVMNEVDGKISMSNKLLDNVIPKTTDVNYLAGYLFSKNFTWHYAGDNYSPQAGDIIFLYTPTQTINPDGSITTVDTTPVSELYPSMNVTDTNLRVTSAGIVESCSGGTVTFIYGDSADETVERTTLDMSSNSIVAYVMPKYEDVAGETLVYAGDVLEKGNFLLPFRGTATVSALFGRYPSGGPHTGLDFACPVGTPVVACNAGTVVKADATEKTTYGYHIKIVSQTASGEVTCVYAHMSQLYVKEGEQVASGQVIGLSGNTGNSTGPHIHLTIEENGVKRNPAVYLRDRDKIKLHAVVTA